ncbi:MAG TPA: ABC transporter substrate-binding protein [Chloroflexota bacterium]|nr:ABC transporter substrate-binding protein [Chloroflexota bacterium]
MSRLALAAGLLLALALAACAGAARPPQPASPAGSAARPAQPADSGASGAPAAASPTSGQAADLPPTPPARTTLRFPYSAIGGSMAVGWIAKEAGYLADEGIDAEMEYIATSTTFTQALLAGEMQIGMGGLEALVASNAAGADLVGLAVSTDRFVFRLYARPGIGSLAELRGQRLAVARTGSTSYTAAQLLLRRVGLEAGRDVEMLSAGGTPEMYAALESGAAQAALLPPPMSFQADAAGYPVLADTIEEDLPFHQSLLVTTRRYVAEQEDVVRRVVRAYVRAVARSKLDKEYYKRVLAQYAQITDPDVLEKTWAIQDRVQPRVPYFRPEALQIAIDAVAEQRPEVRGATPQDFVDERFLREFDQSGYIASLYP